MRSIYSAVLIALATPALAQLPSSSAVAFATGDAFVARARGFNAVAWNPAGLGMADNPGFSATVASVQGVASMGPVSLSEFKKYEGDTVPFAVREKWQQQIEKEGGQLGGAIAGITELGISSGSFAFQMGTQASLVANLGPGASELIFFGNAGRTGEPRDITAAGSVAFASATTTLGASYGRAISSGDRKIAAGLTVKYTMGHMMAFASDIETNVGTNPLAGQVFFPLIQSKTSGGIMKNLNNGSGIGLDLGVAASRGSWRYGAAIQNVINTFKWDASKFTIRRNFLDVATFASDFGEHELSEFPEVADAIEDLTFKPVLLLGGAYEAGTWTGALDLRRRTDDEGFEGGPMTQVGAGIEWRHFKAIPLMLGTAWSSDAILLSGGIGLRLGGINATLAGGLSKTESGSDPVLAFTLSTGTR